MKTLSNRELQLIIRSVPEPSRTDIDRIEVSVEEKSPVDFIDHDIFQAFMQQERAYLYKKLFILHDRFGHTQFWAWTYDGTTPLFHAHIEEE